MEKSDRAENMIIKVKMVMSCICNNIIFVYNYGHWSFSELKGRTQFMCEEMSMCAHKNVNTHKNKETGHTLKYNLDFN